MIKFQKNMHLKKLILFILVLFFIPLNLYAYNEYVSVDSLETCSESNGDDSLTNPICSRDKVVSAQLNQRNINYTLNYNSSLGLVDDNITITQVYVSFGVDSSSTSRNIDEFVELVNISDGWAIKDLNGNPLTLEGLNNNFDSQDSDIFRFELIESNGISKSGGDELLNFTFRTKQASSTIENNSFFDGEVLIKVQDVKILRVEDDTSDILLDSVDLSLSKSDRKFLAKKTGRFSGDNLVTEGKIRFIPSLIIPNSSISISEQSTGPNVNFTVNKIGDNENYDFNTNFDLVPNAVTSPGKNQMIINQNYLLDEFVDQQNGSVTLDLPDFDGGTLAYTNNDFQKRLGFDPLDDPFDNPTRSLTMQLSSDPNIGTLGMQYHLINTNQRIDVTDNDSLPRLSIQFYDESTSSIIIDEQNYIPEASSGFLFSTRLNKQSGFLFSDITDHTIIFELNIGSDNFGNVFPSGSIGYTLNQVTQDGDIITSTTNARTQVTDLGDGNVSLEIIINEKSDLGTNWNWSQPLPDLPNPEAYFQLVPYNDEIITQVRKVDVLLGSSQNTGNYTIGNDMLEVYIGDNDRPSICVDPFEMFNFVTRDEYINDSDLQLESSFDRYGFFSLFGMNKLVSFFRTSLNDILAGIFEPATEIDTTDADPSTPWFDYDPQDGDLKLIRIQGQDCAGYEGKYVDYYDIVNDPSRYELYQQP